MRPLHGFARRIPRKIPNVFPKLATPKKTASGRWHIQIEVAGQREHGTFPTYREAQAWSHRRSTELRAMRSGAVGSIKTLRDALRRYAEDVAPKKRGATFEIRRLAYYETNAHKALPVRKKLAEVTTADLALWRDARLRMNARGSVLRDITLLSGVFEIARREWGWIESNPMRDVGKPQNPDHRERVISGTEIRAMLRQLGHGGPVRTVSQAAAMCFLAALATGMRAGELCGLTWDAVHADHCRLTMTKNGSARDVPLSKAAKRLLDRMRGWDRQSVFGIGSQTLDALFRRARDRAGLAGFTFHDSRRTAATRLSRKVDLLMLCRIMGWKNPKQAMAYYAPSSKQIARLLDA